MPVIALHKEDDGDNVNLDSGTLYTITAVHKQDEIVTFVISKV